MKIKKNLKIFITAARPKTLGAAVSPIIIGTAMAFSMGNGHMGSALACLFCALLIQIGTNFSNDYFDYVKGSDTEERIGPTRITQAGLVTPKCMVRNFVCVFGLAVLVGTYLVFRGGWPVFFIGLISITSGILYTGGPIPLGYVGLGDIFVMIFFGPVAVGGTFYVQALELPKEVILAGFGPGLLATSLLCINNLRDEPTDKKSGKKTLAVIFGPKFVRIEFLVTFTLALFLPYVLALLTNSHWFVCLSTLILIPGYSAVLEILKGVKGVELNRILSTTGKLIMLYGLLFSIGWLIG